MKICSLLFILWADKQTKVKTQPVFLSVSGKLDFFKLNFLQFLL